MAVGGCSLDEFRVIDVRVPAIWAALPVKKNPSQLTLQGFFCRSEAVPNDGLFGGQTGGRPGGLGRFPDGNEHHGNIT
ncbi:hypothetical protein DJ90_5728 [Paenibacillus macerans]|uniref:Uncharacterized protein n=1 Tax=Paenibacillus macerans TaxID=44252 RepID=A0A090ZLA8_PAEMA|nr:hypothetical protein DJ90_5728 [Paenibacillus macerans]